MGTWESKEDTEAFMKTGVFITLKENLSPYMIG